MMYVHRRPTRRRCGTAAVELAVISPFLILLIIGVWELGRLIQVQQLLNNAARDGARVAAQAQTINVTGAYTQIAFKTGSLNVEDTIRDSLQVAGITNLTGLKIEYQFLDGDTTSTDPYQGKKNQKFRIRVTLPYENIRWTSLSLVNPSVLTGECVWTILVDDPFTLNAKLPSWYPIQAQ